MTEQEFRARTVQLARSWIGTPWKKYGRSRDGVDCGGLVICVGREIGAFHFSLDAGERHYELGVYKGVWAWPGLDEVPWDQVAPGDVAMGSRNMQTNAPWHVGIVGEKGGVLTLIHYERSVSRVTEELLTDRMRGRICRANRFRFPPRSILEWPANG